MILQLLIATFFFVGSSAKPMTFEWTPSPSNPTHYAVCWIEKDICITTPNTKATAPSVIGDEVTVAVRAIRGERVSPWIFSDTFHVRPHFDCSGDKEISGLDYLCWLKLFGSTIDERGVIEK